MSVQSPKSKVQSTDESEARLRKLYERWELLSQSESKAIRNRDWAGLSQFQDEKQTLADEISGIHQAAGGQPHQAVLKPLLEQLVVLETQNIQMLASEQQRLAEEQNALSQAGRTLQQVHRAYVRDPSLIWNAYS